MVDIGEIHCHSGHLNHSFKRETGERSSSLVMSSSTSKPEFPEGETDRALGELTRYWLKAQPSIAAFISASVWDVQDGEDLVQQVAEICAKKFAKYDRQRSFLSWALGIARNELLLYYRKQEKSKVVLSPATLELVSEELSSREPELDDRFAALRECIKKVVGRPRQMLEMRYYRDMKPDEISRRLGLSPAAVRVSLCRVRQDLGGCIRRQLRRQEYSHE